MYDVRSDKTSLFNTALEGKPQPCFTHGDRRGDKRQRIHHDSGAMVDAAKRRLIPPTNFQSSIMRGVTEMLLEAHACFFQNIRAEQDFVTLVCIF